QAGGQLSDGSLSDRCRLPATAVGGAAANAGHAEEGFGGAGARGGERLALCLLGYVEAVFRGDCRAGESGAARARSLSHYDAREPGRRSGTARRKHALAGGGQARAAQAYALDLVAPRQSRPRSSSAKAASVVIEQTGHSPSLGAEGILVPSLDVQVSALGQDLPGLLVLASDAQPIRADEESRPRMLRAHEELLMNWFRAKGEISSGAVEGLNNKIRVVTRRSYGFRTYRAMEIALYHTLGRLPEPPWTHRFC